jgi:hypothetical protein
MTDFPWSQPRPLEGVAEAIDRQCLVVLERTTIYLVLKCMLSSPANISITHSMWMSCRAWSSFILINTWPPMARAHGNRWPHWQALVGHVAVSQLTVTSISESLLAILARECFQLIRRDWGGMQQQLGKLLTQINAPLCLGQGVRRRKNKRLCTRWRW